MTIGYIALRIDGKYVYEHRYLMERMIGRKLERNELVHHKNHDKTDNRPENLELTTRDKHGKYHAIEHYKQPDRGGFGFAPGHQTWKLRKAEILKQAQK